MLIVFGGLPGVGKTAIAKSLASRIGAVLLRLDSLEHGFASAGIVDISAMGPAGYYAAQAAAADNLALDLDVVADMVNPFRITREAWRRTAQRAGKALLEIEVVCDDVGEHRRRVEARTSDIDGFTLPTWREVLDREYEPWVDADVRLDSAALSVEQCVERIAVHYAKKKKTESR